VGGTKELGKGNEVGGGRDEIFASAFEPGLPCKKRRRKKIGRERLNGIAQNQRVDLPWRIHKTGRTKGETGEEM